MAVVVLRANVLAKTRMSNSAGPEHGSGFNKYQVVDLHKYLVAEFISSQKSALLVL